MIILCFCRGARLTNPSGGRWSWSIIVSTTGRKAATLDVQDKRVTKAPTLISEKRATGPWQCQHCSVSLKGAVMAQLTLTHGITMMYNRLVIGVISPFIIVFMIAAWSIVICRSPSSTRVQVFNVRSFAGRQRRIAGWGATLGWGRWPSDE